ncbi:MAG: group 1 truncated hemoglobin [Gammaproteobacteria bacterium]
MTQQSISKRSLFGAFAIALAVSIAGCSGMMGKKEEMKEGMEKKEEMEKKMEASLYDRLGGKTAIAAVVDEFVGNVAGDKRINKFFAKTDIGHLKAMLVDQICAGTGGPCTYNGKDMKTTHAGMGITEAHFNALVEDLVKALNKLNVPEKEQNELLGILGPMKSDIVTR